MTLHNIISHQQGADRQTVKGLIMTNDTLSREGLIQELQNISEQLARLAEGGVSPDNMSQELEALSMRVAYLMRELNGSDTSSKGEAKSKVVLVVDDNDEFRLFIRRALELSDFNVIEASGGEEALAVIREKPSLDLVVCDVILPGMKGPELMRKIRDQFPDTKVIFMSGYIAEDIVNQDVEKILASGGFFLQKPFPTRELLEVVHEMLDV